MPQNLVLGGRNVERVEYQLKPVVELVHVVGVHYQLEKDTIMIIGEIKLHICKGLCQTPKLTTKGYSHIWSKLDLTWKKCKTCCVTIKTQSWKCPCCGRKLKGISYQKQSLLTN